MGFKIENITNQRRNMPEGRYLVLNGIDWLVTEITISASGRVCLKLHDPMRRENQVRTLCTLEELVAATVEGAVYREI